MKFKLDSGHALYLAAIGALVGLMTWDHFHGTPLSWALAWKIGAFIVLAILMLLKRSPADLAALLSGELVTLTTGAPAAPPPPPPPATRNGWIRVPLAAEVAGFCGCCAGIILLASAWPLPACKPANSLVDVSEAGVVSVTEAGQDVANAVNCVFTHLDERQDPIATAEACGVTAQDVFQIAKLFDQRAAARRLCPSSDVGK
jgi:hypothetical protein